jgi:hypothetical protein
MYRLKQGSKDIHWPSFGVAFVLCVAGFLCTKKTAVQWENGGTVARGGHESLRKDISTDGSGSPPEGPTQDAEEDKSCQQYQKEFHDCLRKVGGIASHMLPMKP